LKINRIATTILACGLLATGSLAALADDGSAGRDGLPAGVPYASDKDPVRITAVNFSPSEPKRGDLVTAQVTCSSNAAAVTVAVGTIRVIVPKKAPGIFRTQLRVPTFAFYPAHQTIIVTAIRTDGATVQRSVSVDIH